ncbi:hypothetical protein IM40_06120 [Candidatus Paracaedimonas acanthamoebae]|nr:hypothetical protein IM40_06120 [Candidatus Paracaedimonas acanthamoebae]
MKLISFVLTFFVFFFSYLMPALATSSLAEDIYGEENISAKHIMRMSPSTKRKASTLGPISDPFSALLSQKGKDSGKKNYKTVGTEFASKEKPKVFSTPTKINFQDLVNILDRVEVVFSRREARLKSIEVGVKNLISFDIVEEIKKDQKTRASLLKTDQANGHKRLKASSPKIILAEYTLTGTSIADVVLKIEFHKVKKTEEVN